MKPKSIGRSLLLRIEFSIGLLLVVLSIWIYLTVRHGLYRELDKSITQTAALLSNQVELENGRIIFEWQEGQGTNRALIDDGLFQFWDETTGATTRSPGLQAHDLPRFSGDGTKPLLKDIDLPRNNHHARAIGIRIFPYNAPEDLKQDSANHLVDPKTQPHILVVARDAKPLHRLLNRVRWILSIGTLLTLGIVYFLISRVIRISLKPIDELANHIKNRTEQQLDAALELPASLPNELNGVAENFDVLLSRLAMARVRERDFIRHAAHELRTPIAGLRAVTELALSQPRSVADYINQLAACQKTAIELSELVNRLTALSRVGQQHAAPPLRRIELTRILKDCILPFSEISKHRNLTFMVNLPSESVFALADEALARIIFNNLLDNATCYATPHSEVHIRANVSETKIRFTFSNYVETPLTDPERLFEPLFRSDSSRQDATAHLGIGLTLAKEAATAMNATLDVHLSSDGRLEFILVL